MISKEQILENVKQNGTALRYVKEQTPEICLEAVKQNGIALEYVKEQTPEIYLEALKQNVLALEHVEKKYIKKIVETYINIEENK